MGANMEYPKTRVKWRISSWRILTMCATMVIGTILYGITFQMYDTKTASFRPVRVFTVENKLESDQRTFVISWYMPISGIVTGDYSATNMSLCKYSNCLLNTTRITSDEISKGVSSDAILFQGNRIEMAIPKRRDSNQVFVFVDNEAPNYLHSKVYRSMSWDSAFNWTMTYRHDSDILYTYGGYERTYRQSGQNQNAYFSDVFKKKVKSAAWIVSHCKTNSKRELFVQKLQEYIDVDIYGHCYNSSRCGRTKYDLCIENITEKYKFYLAFENCLCKDYVTEKSFSWMGRDIVTVIRGPKDVRHILPDKTYVTSTGSAKQLANFLIKLGNDEAAYTEYLRRKRNYVYYSRTDSAQQAYCQLCTMLNHLPNHRKSYPSIYEWWAPTCSEPTDLQ